VPERNEVQDELAAQWEADLPTETADFAFEMLHPGLVRSLICEIGSECGVLAVYWRGGVKMYDTDTRSHALIEQHMQDGWRGSIRLETQRGQARLLLERLSRWIEDRSGRGALRVRRVGSPTPPSAASAEPAPPGRLPGTFGPAPVVATEYFVSYAWGDDKSPEGLERETIVNRLCAAAEARKINIIRDNNTLRPGDRITPFMRRIGAGDRVFVILSNKYLHSPFCMFELLEIWRYSRSDEADFRRRVRIYALPDAAARTTGERIRLAAHWKAQHEDIAALIKEHGAEIIGDQDFARFKLMGQFYRDVPDILFTMFDTVQPRSFEELVQYGFQDA
jgi:internalin A